MPHLDIWPNWLPIDLSLYSWINAEVTKCVSRYLEYILNFCLLAHNTQASTSPYRSHRRMRKYVIDLIYSRNIGYCATTMCEQSNIPYWHEFGECGSHFKNRYRTWGGPNGLIWCFMAHHVTHQDTQVLDQEPSLRRFKYADPDIAVISIGAKMSWLILLYRILLGTGQNQTLRRVTLLIIVLFTASVPISLPTFTSMTSRARPCLRYWMMSLP